MERIDIVIREWNNLYTIETWKTGTSEARELREGAEERIEIFKTLKQWAEDEIVRELKLKSGGVQ